MLLFISMHIQNSPFHFQYSLRQIDFLALWVGFPSFIAAFIMAVEGFPNALLHHHGHFLLSDVLQVCPPHHHSHHSPWNLEERSMRRASFQPFRRNHLIQTRASSATTRLAKILATRLRRRQIPGRKRLFFRSASAHCLSAYLIQRQQTVATGPPSWHTLLRNPMSASVGTITSIAGLVIFSVASSQQNSFHPYDIIFIYKTASANCQVLNPGMPPILQPGA